MSEISRREFVKSTAIAAASLQFAGATRVLGQAVPAIAATGVALHWLEGVVPVLTTGVTWGVPWPRGELNPRQAFALRTANGEAVAMQSWPLGYWPDGSLKWSAHSVAANSGLADKLLLTPGEPSAPVHVVTVRETSTVLEIDTGLILCKVARSGSTIIQSIERGGKQILKGGRLVCLTQDKQDFGDEGVMHQESYLGEVTSVKVEQNGPVRAVVKLGGRHQGGANKRAWLPFTVRLYFSAGSEAVRIMHSFVFDGAEHKDFIRGLGVRFDVVMHDQLLHDRHVRFAGEGKGQWAEGVRNLTGLRRDAGQPVKDAQVAGRACPPVETFPAAVNKRLGLIPAWGDYTLSQSGPDSFEIRKRTKPGCGWITADNGGRSSGVGYIGGASGGVVFGLRDFWQRYPTQLDIRKATTDEAEVTVWMWSPDAPAMDLRFYHDGMGMETHAQEIEGLEITYEDYEKGFGTPVGIARSSELTLWVLPATPSRERFADMAAVVSVPPILACNPEQVVKAQVFGAMWKLPDRSTPARAAIEDRLDWFFEYYKKQVEERHWYGFWNYGDIRHTYDKDRHVWRYDVGGFAWDNSELSPDLWLWFGYMRTGRADIFRMAEAMTRHTGEVDVYHLGRFAGLGTRHGVQHWGDSGKQVRISTSIYRRFYYFLTADERVGDLMHELVDADQKLVGIDAVRKLPDQAATTYPARVSVGTDWCSFAANWLAEWERTGESKYRDKLVTGMNDIGAAPHGFFSGDRFGYDPATGHLYNILGDKASASHLGAVFGAVEVCAELIQNLDNPAFERAWLQYCELYNATPEERQKTLGDPLPGNSLRTAHSRLTGYAAWRKKDRRLAERAWNEFFGSSDGNEERHPMKTTRIEGPNALNPIDEAPWVSTNDTAQWGLAAIQNLALIGGLLDAGDPRTPN